jgi:hypothetical protein
VIHGSDLGAYDTQGRYVGLPSDVQSISSDLLLNDLQQPSTQNPVWIQNIFNFSKESYHL